jgi:O-antigen ligase
MIFRGLHRDMIPLAGLLTIIPVGAMIFSGARGGIVSFDFELAVLALLARFCKAPRGTQRAALTIVGLAALALVAWLGAGKALERFSGLHPGDVTLSRRASMVRGAAHIFIDHPTKGAGLGSLVAVYPRYETHYAGYVVAHVHNDYMELIAEMGILGGLCGFAFLWILFRAARNCFTVEQGHFSRAIHARAIAALFGILLHSLIDFNLRIPSTALLFLLQAYLAASPPLPSEAPMEPQRIRSRENAPLEQ